MLSVSVGRLMSGESKRFNLNNMQQTLTVDLCMRADLLRGPRAAGCGPLGRGPAFSKILFSTRSLWLDIYSYKQFRVFVVLFLIEIFDGVFSLTVVQLIVLSAKTVLKWTKWLRK